MEKLTSLLSQKIARDSNPPTGPYSDIERIAERGVLIWPDSKGSKEATQRKYTQVAETLASRLTPDVLDEGNEGFYKGVSAETHIRSLRLLSALVPESEEEREKFREGPVDVLIMSYLRGIKANIIEFPIMGKTSDYTSGLASYLITYSGLPRDYLISMNGQVGIPFRPSQTTVPTYLNNA